MRIPLVAGVNDDEDKYPQDGGFLAALPGIEGIDLLPYHASAAAKYRKLEMTYGGCDLRPPDPRHIKKLIEILNTSGFDVRLGG